MAVHRAPRVARSSFAEALEQEPEQAPEEPAAAQALQDAMEQAARRDDLFCLCTHPPSCRLRCRS